MAKVSASLIGLGLFGYIGLPFYARKAADYVSKLHLAQAWPFSGSDNNSDWVRVEGQVLKTDVIQLEEQCYAPRIIYSYKTDASNDVQVNDAIGLKQYDFSKIKTRTQDALPFHFLSRGTSVKFVSSLINNNNKVVVRYNKANPSQSILEPQSSEYQLDNQSTAPQSTTYPPYVPLQSAPGAPIYASHLAPQNDPPQYHRFFSAREATLLPRAENLGQVATYMLPFIHLTGAAVLSQKLWRTHKVVVLGAWACTAGWSVWGWTRPQLSEAWQYKSVTDAQSSRAALEHFEQHRYTVSRGYLKSWEHAKTVQL
jgi:hypothetical protein